MHSRSMEGDEAVDRPRPIAYNEIAGERSLERIGALHGRLVIALLIGTIPGIVFVILVQLNAAIAPRLPILWRL